MSYNYLLIIAHKMETKKSNMNTMKKGVVAFEQAFIDSTRYFDGDEMAAKTFLDANALRDLDGNLLENSPEMMHRRMAKEFARIEKNKFRQPLSEEKIYSLFDKFKYLIPQSSPMTGIGNDIQILSLSNCFVTDSPKDSYGGICRVDENIAQLSKRRGGVGVNLSNLRPAGTPTTNASRTATGVITFAERYSNTIREVGQNGRRGALMAMLNIHHPESVIIPDSTDASWASPEQIVIKGNSSFGERDISTLSCYYNPKKLDFVSMKLDRTKVTGANVSVALTDEFLDAVKTNTDYEQRFPVDSKSPSIRKMVNAKNAWKKIIHMAWQSAEPGVIFWDRMIKYNAVDCYKDDGFDTVCTNPCGEIPLCADDSCRLMVVNLLSFVDDPFTKKSSFNFELFKEYVSIGQRLMDDLIDMEVEKVDRIIKKIEGDPEDISLKQNELDLWKRVRIKAVNGRRTGLGITALADMLAALNIKFDSDEAMIFVDTVMMNFKHAAFESSCNMAKELGAFPIWNWEKEKNSEFLLQLKAENPHLYEKISKYGRRNIGLLTLAPTGTPSIFAQTSSSGEPVYSLSYMRRKKINPGDKNSKIDFVDGKGDSWQHFAVYHKPLEMWMKINGESDIKKSPWSGCCSNEIDWKRRVILQSVIQKHIDHSISSTVNLPNSATEEDVSMIYETAWKSGCKGITVYRDGCRSGVLVSDNNSNNAKIIKTTAIKRPRELRGEIYATHYKREKIYVALGFLGDDLYEVFTGINFRNKIGSASGKIVKLSKQKYMFVTDSGAEYLLTNGHSDDNADALTRMISCALRHGASIHMICDQLQKTIGDMTAFSKVIARILKKHVKENTISTESCPQCNSKLVYQNGCKSCLSCGHSACK
jgi:ribonucleoside-diphosphate reductase alpha chain